MPTHIGLSDERAGQLKLLAQKLGVSNAEAIGYMLNKAIDDGLIAREITGFDIRVGGGRVKLEIIDPDHERLGDLYALAAWGMPNNDLLTPDEAREFAEKIERIASDSGYKVVHEPMAPYNLARVGTGIRISSFMGRKRVVPKDVARDLAAMIRMAADEAGN